MTRLISTSFSRVQDYEKCPLQFKYKHLDKIPDPAPELPEGQEHAKDRGTRIHKLAEDFVGSDDHEVPEELKWHSKRFLTLQKLHKKGIVDLELQVAFDRDWKLSAGNDFENTVYRMVADVVVWPSSTKVIIVDHKGLDVATKIPTPKGFTTMGDIQVGDKLFDMHGEICQVTEKSEVKQIGCYRVTFNDGSSVVCDEEHLWRTVEGEVIGVHDLMGKRTAKQRINVPRIPVTEPMLFSKKELPIHPYVLGLWIADGKNSSGEISKPDAFVWEKIQSLGYEVNMDVCSNDKCPTRTVKGIRGHLNSLGLLGNKDKFIPEVYLQGNTRQRLDLIQGLMDGDGSVNPARKQAIYCTVNPALAKQVQQLLNSMGQQSYISPFKAKGFGLEVDAHYVSFRPWRFNPFSLPKKAEKIKPWGPGKAEYRIAKSVELVPTRPTQCIAVDSDTHTYLCTEWMIPTHNTGKRKGNEIKHHDQLMEYACSFMLLYPDLQIFDVQIWYLDMFGTDNVMRRTFTRSQVARAFPRMKKRHETVRHATIFPAQPSQYACIFCPFKAGMVGRGRNAYPGTGHCRKNAS